MIDFLEWISRNGGAAFLLGVLFLFVACIVADSLVRLVRAITGNYPPASFCDADDPCYCCRDNGCQSGCRCNDEDDDDGDGA